jgi:hypothetical protein
VSKPGQDTSILPEGAEGRRVQALNGMEKFRTQFRGLATERGTYPLHRSKEIHDKRRRGTLGPLKQQRGTTFPQNPLRYLSCFQDWVYFDPDALKLPCCFEVRDEGLQISESHDA